MVVGLLGNKSPDSNRLTLVTPKPENGVRLQATLSNQNLTGLPMRAVRKFLSAKTILERKTCGHVKQMGAHFKKRLLSGDGSFYKKKITGL